jgi:DNA-binding HxlR family transcriptional regulator
VTPELETAIGHVMDIKAILRGDWAGAILVLLGDGRQWQFRAVRDEMATWVFHDPWAGRRRSLSASELTRTLGRMVEDGLLVRTEMLSQWQPAVFYELSSEARSMVAAAQPLLRWVAENRSFFAQAQAARGRRRPASERH